MPAVHYTNLLIVVTIGLLASSSTTGTLILVGVFGLVVALVGVAIAGAERSISLSHVLRRLQDTTAQIRVRAASGDHAIEVPDQVLQGSAADIERDRSTDRFAARRGREAQGCRSAGGLARARIG